MADHRNPCCSSQVGWSRVPGFSLCLHSALLQEFWLWGLRASPVQLGIFMAFVSLCRFTFWGRRTDRQKYKQTHKEDDSHLVGDLEKMRVQWMESDGDCPGRPMLSSGGEAPRTWLWFWFEMSPKRSLFGHGPFAAVFCGVVFVRWFDTEGYGVLDGSIHWWLHSFVANPTLPPGQPKVNSFVLLHAFLGILLHDKPPKQWSQQTIDQTLWKPEPKKSFYPTYLVIALGSQLTQTLIVAVVEQGEK